jgi:hypothetical protein
MRKTLPDSSGFDKGDLLREDGTATPAGQGYIVMTTAKSKKI